MEKFYRVSFDADSAEKYKIFTISKSDNQKTICKKISYLFLRGYVLLLKANVAELLISKYNELVIFDSYGNIISNSDDLDSLNLSELIFEAQKYRINYHNKSSFELKMAIREKREKNRKSA